MKRTYIPDKKWTAVKMPLYGPTALWSEWCERHESNGEWSFVHMYNESFAVALPTFLFEYAEDATAFALTF